MHGVTERHDRLLARFGLGSFAFLGGTLLGLDDVLPILTSAGLRLLLVERCWSILTNVGGDGGTGDAEHVGDGRPIWYGQLGLRLVVRLGRLIWYAAQVPTHGHRADAEHVGGPLGPSGSPPGCSCGLGGPSGPRSRWTVAPPTVKRDRRRLQRNGSNDPDNLDERNDRGPYDPSQPTPAQLTILGSARAGAAARRARSGSRSPTASHRCADCVRAASAATDSSRTPHDARAGRAEGDDRASRPARHNRRRSARGWRSSRRGDAGTTTRRTATRGAARQRRYRSASVRRRHLASGVGEFAGAPRQDHDRR